MKMEEKEKNILMDKVYSSAIMLSLRDKVLRQVSKDNTTSRIWSKHKGLCMTKSLVNCFYLEQSLYSFKIEECLTIESELDIFNILILDLENIKMTLMMKIRPS